MEPIFCVDMGGWSVSGPADGLGLYASAGPSNGLSVSGGDGLTLARSRLFLSLLGVELGEVVCQDAADNFTSVQVLRLGNLLDTIFVIGRYGERCGYKFVFFILD